MDIEPPELPSHVDCQLVIWCALGKTGLSETMFSAMEASQLHHADDLVS